MIEGESEKSEIMNQVETYLKMTQDELDAIVKNPTGLSATHLVALRYVNGMISDHKMIADYLDRTQGKPVQKLVTKDETFRNVARKMTDEELDAELLKQGIDPNTGLPSGATFTQQD